MPHDAFILSHIALLCSAAWTAHRNGVQISSSRCISYPQHVCPKRFQPSPNKGQRSLVPRSTHSHRARGVRSLHVKPSPPFHMKETYTCKRPTRVIYKYIKNIQNYKKSKKYKKWIIPFIQIIKWKSDFLKMFDVRKPSNSSKTILDVLVFL